MFRSIVSGALLAMAALPSIAVAQDGEKLDCITHTASPELKASIAEAAVHAMMTENETADATGIDAQSASIWQVIASCGAKHGVDAEEMEHYFDYSLARIVRDWVRARAEETGLSLDPVDKIFDFGPGRANADLSGKVLDERLAAVRAAYQARGVGVDRLDGEVFERVVVYIVVTPNYWRAREALGQ